MRGQPSLQLLLIVAAFLAAGVPVWRLTRPARGEAAAGQERVASLPADAATGAAETTVELRVEFAPAPAGFELQHLGRTVLDGRGAPSAAAEFAGRWTVRLPAEGADLALQVRWPAAANGDAGQPAAARVRARFPDGREVEKTFWSPRGEPLVELFTVPGSPPPGP